MQISVSYKNKQQIDMSLVAYGSSDESDSDESDSGGENETVIKTKDQSTKFDRKKKIIEAPSLKNDDSDDDVNYQPPKKKDSSISLFAKLPAPKYSDNKTVKIQLSKMTAPRKTALAQKSKLLEKFKKKQTTTNSEEINNEDEDEEIMNDENNASEESESFFSFNSEPKVASLPAPDLNIKMPSVKAPVEYEAPNYNVNMPYHGSDVYHQPQYSYQAEPDQPSSSSSATVDTNLQRIQGKRFRDEKVDFIEIKADDALIGNQENLLKTISEEKDNKRKSHKKGDGPSAMQKKKHQLTYLIHQAQEREIELKNAWAANRHSKRQTQMKYGF